MSDEVLRPGRAVGWVLDEDDDRAVVAPLPSGPARILLGPAARLWRELAAGATRQAAVAGTVGAYADPPAQAGDELTALVDELLGAGLLEAGPAAAPAAGGRR